MSEPRADRIKLLSVAGVVDSQPVKSTAVGAQERAYDAAKRK